MDEPIRAAWLRGIVVVLALMLVVAFTAHADDNAECEGESEQDQDRLAEALARSSESDSRSTSAEAFTVMPPQPVCEPCGVFYYSYRVNSNDGICMQYEYDVMKYALRQDPWPSCKCHWTYRILGDRKCIGRIRSG